MTLQCTLTSDRHFLVRKLAARTCVIKGNGIGNNHVIRSGVDTQPKVIFCTGYVTYAYH